MEKNTDPGLAGSEKNTASNRAIKQKRRLFAATAGRLGITALLVAAVVFVALPVSRAAATVPPNYGSLTLSTGASPSAVRVADLDGDGRNDIAVVTLQGNLQLFFNNGAGNFQRLSLNGLWPAGSNPLSLEIGDFNGDGRNDIAVALATASGSISVLLNQGSRSFAAPVGYSVCAASNSVAIGDLDQDGDNDLADISQCSRSSILLNNGQGHFTYNGAYGSGYNSRSVAVADLNRDGFKDIIYINNGLGSTSGSNLTVILNNGNATFGPATWYYAGENPEDLAVGDFDGNGSLDVAITDNYLSEIWILLNDGNGNLTGYSEFYGGDTPDRIVAADFNSDGRLDFAVTSQGNNRLSIFINQGNYNFAGPTIFNLGQTPVAIAAGKLDGDALPDLVAVNQGSGTITVLLSAGSTPPPPPPPPQITLTVSTRVTKRERLVDLRWSGAAGTNVDIYRNGSRLVTVSNTGGYSDTFNLRARGTYTYKVCGTGGQPCSNNATINF